MKETKARAAAVRMLVLDVDGTLTDGGIYTGATGELFKRFDIKDGLGIALWHKAGGKTAVITGSDTNPRYKPGKQRNRTAQFLWVSGQAHQHTQNHPDLVFAPSGINTEPAKRDKH